MKNSSNNSKAFNWAPQPMAFDFICTLAVDFLAECPDALAFANRIRSEAGVRFVDLIDHIRLNQSDSRASQLEDVGYQKDGNSADCDGCTKGSGIFPPILLWNGETEIGIRVESVADFLSANHIHAPIQGAPTALLRTSRVFTGQYCSLLVIERHGTRSFDVISAPSIASERRLFHLEKFKTRDRSFGNDEEGFDYSNKLIESAIEELGHGLACDVWFAAEREFWMSRNRAARIQKTRQGRLGLGWANHDHHTYRSSRKSFKHLIALWEKLGLKCREQYYAGREAGWGAQVMEDPITGIVTFNDVDLSPDELMGDFSHEGLEERDRLGTVGLWCGLHGDSFLQSGLHHLAGMFDFALVQKQLGQETEAAIKTMSPFTFFTYLKQAFTEGERWSVEPARVDRLLNSGLITPEQASQFLEKSAIGSHLEILERNDGFKGFNQAGVNEIISATDPRKN